MDSKPIILSEDNSLVDQDLSNVYAHWLNENPPIIHQHDVKFKKKEQIETLKKSVLKHRIRVLTGKDLTVIESEVGKSFASDDDLKKLAKLLILEAAGKLPTIEKPITKDSRKRPFVEDTGDVQEPTRKKGRRSIAIPPSPAAAASTSTPTRRSRKSILPQTPILEPEPVNSAMDIDEEEENDDFDISDLGPNPTQQMIDLKRKKLKGKKGSNSSPKKVKEATVQKVVAKKIEDPVRNEFPGENCAIYLFEANIAEKSHGYLDFAKLQKLTGPEFQGAHFTFIHTPIDWSPTDVFTVSMNIKLLNRRANQDVYSIMVGCGIENVNLLASALKRHTKQVQVIVFERDDMNENANSSHILRETTTLFLVAYFFPGCDKEGIMPPAPMVRPNLTTCFRTKNIEDLENTIIHSFSEVGDWILDICCGSRELSLAAQKSGRNAIAFDGNIGNLSELSVKASAIARHHDPKFRHEVDGNILTI